MYSNNIIYAFFVIILCFAPLISAKLSPDHYNNTCPSLQDKVLWGVRNATRLNPFIPAYLLRIHFHDCFVNGCDASLLLDGTPKTQGEKSAYLNRQVSYNGYKLIDNIKKDVEASCPKTVSCADILTLAARASIKLALEKRGDIINVMGTREPYGVALGRLDGLVANRTAADKELPSFQDSIDTVIAKFAAKSLEIKDLVVLSGAYTISFAYFKNSKNIVARPGWKSNNAIAQMIEFYNANTGTFLKDFGNSMTKISTTDVITTGGGLRMGEIRTNCHSTNSK